MKRKARLSGIALLLLPLAACASATTTKTTVYTPGGQLADQTVASNDRVDQELHRIFDTTVMTGDGMFDNRNEGLARQSALSLAQADLAQKVQSQVRANTVVMNNEDVRSVVETSVNAVIRNFEVDSAGYDPNSTKYRVRISVKGESLVKEIERRRTR
jgi:hypothetical protein